MRVDSAYDDVLRLYRTLYLAEVLVAGVTLEEQARFVAERMRDVLRELRGARPDGKLTLPPRRGRRRRDGDSDDAQTADDATDVAPT